MQFCFEKTLKKHCYSIKIINLFRIEGKIEGLKNEKSKKNEHKVQNPLNYQSVKMYFSRSIEKELSNAG